MNQLSDLDAASKLQVTELIAEYQISAWSEKNLS
jgi:hypothetical protein